MARGILWMVAVLWIIGGIVGDVRAQNAVQQVLAQIDYLIAAVFIVGAEIVAASQSARGNRPEAAATSDKEDPTFGPWRDTRTAGEIAASRRRGRKILIGIVVAVVVACLVAYIVTTGRT